MTPVSSSSQDSSLGEAARYKKAVLTLTAQLQEAPKNVEAAVALAEALARIAARTDRAEDRVKYLNRACAVDPYDARHRRNLGMARLAAGDENGAMASLRAALALDSGDPCSWVTLGWIRLQRLTARPNVKEADRAIEAFDRAVALDPLSPAPHAGRLLAACYARVASPEKSRLLKMLPDDLLALRPARVYVPFLVRLGMSIAFSAYYRKLSDKKVTTGEKGARKRAFQGLRRGLEPWLQAFPDDERLTMVTCAVAILECEEDELAARIAEAVPLLNDPRLLQLVVHQRLEEVESVRRFEILSAVGEATPLHGGLDRALLSSLNSAARTSVCRREFAVAADLWRRGLAVDPYNPAFHHNLALLALSQQHREMFDAHLESSVDLQITYWLLADGKSELPRYLCARYETISERVRKQVMDVLHDETAEIDPELLGRWIAESMVHFVLQYLVLAHPDGNIPFTLRLTVVDYLRHFASRPDALTPLPPALFQLMDSPLQATPPFHYDTLTVSKDAAPSAITTTRAKLEEELMMRLFQAMQEQDKEEVTRLGEHLERLKEAFGVLSDLGQRKRYDAETMDQSQHDFHRGRRQFVLDLVSACKILIRRGHQESAALTLRAYRNFPHSNIDSYFDWVQKGLRKLIRDEMASLRLGSAVENAVNQMTAEQWEPALAILRAVFGAGGWTGQSPLYLAAVCEMQWETEFVSRNGRTSAPGMKHTSDNRGAARASTVQKASVPKGLRLLGRNQHGYREFLNERDASILIEVPAGSYVMEFDDGTRRTINVPQFLIGKYPVTNRQFAHFAEMTGHADDGWKSWHDEDDAPVVEVSINHAQEYCRWAGLMLPSEAQWEFAARGSDGRQYPWGNEWDGERCSNGVTGDGELSPVGSRPAGASPFGAMDMAGNVWEWTIAGAEPGYNPDEACARGGSWLSGTPDDFRGASRNCLFDADDTAIDFGFRCARNC